MIDKLKRRIRSFGETPVKKESWQTDDDWLQSLVQQALKLRKDV